MSSKPRTDEEGLRLKALGQAIRDVRKAHGVSQEALAYNAGIDRSHMGKIERGERNVTALNLLRVSKALCVQPSDIFFKAAL